jgi:hypothetical protein
MKRRDLLQGLAAFSEGYGLPRRSEHQAVRKCFATNSALAAEECLPLARPAGRGKQYFFRSL